MRGGDKGTLAARLGLVAAAGLMAGFATGGAEAATTCVANASAVSFGTLGVGSLVGATTTGSVYEGCTGGWPTAGNLATCNAIGAGANSASPAARTMKNGAYAIGYALYSDPGLTTPYAYPGADIFYIPYSGAFGGYLTTTTYARIVSAANPAPGVYTDTYTTLAQSWVSFDTWNTRYPPVTCGPNSIYTSLPLTFTVSVTVPASCAVAAGNLNFGSAGVLTGNVDATAALNVTCTNTTPYAIALGPGNGPGASVERRLMTGAGGATVAYGLYRDAARTQVWGTTPPPSSSANTANGVGTGAAQTLTVYGRVPPQTTPPAGAYADTVIVTLTY